MKGYAGFMEDMCNRAKQEFGEDFNISPTSTIYKMFAPIALQLAVLEGQAIALKRARNIYTATGDDLDDLLTNSLVYRIEGAQATGVCTVKGDGIIDLAKGSIKIKGSNGLIYVNTEYKQINNDGSVEVKFECTELGKKGNIPINNIISTISAPTGVYDVQNDKTPFTGGLNRETDYEYLQRFLLTTRDKEWDLPAIKSAIAKLNGVKSVDAIRNNTMEDATIPKKSIKVVVDGGDDQEIANTIYSKIHTPDTVGSVSKNITMASGHTHAIKFDRPKSVKIDYQYTIIGQNKERVVELLKEYLNEVGVGEFVSAQEFKKRKIDDVTDINLKVLGLAFKKQSEGSGYKSYLQLNFDEKGQCGDGAEV